MNEKILILAGALSRNEMSNYINNKRKEFYDKAIPLFNKLSNLYNNGKNDEIKIINYINIEINFLCEKDCRTLRVRFKNCNKNKAVYFIFIKDNIEYPIQIQDSNNFNGDYQEYINIIEMVDILIDNKKTKDEDKEKFVKIVNKEKLVKIIIDNIKLFRIKYYDIITIVKNKELSAQFICTDEDNSVLQITLYNKKYNEYINIIQNKSNYDFIFDCDKETEKRIIDILYGILNNFVKIIEEEDYSNNEVSDIVSIIEELSKSFKNKLLCENDNMVIKFIYDKHFQYIYIEKFENQENKKFVFVKDRLNDIITLLTLNTEINDIFQEKEILTYIKNIKKLYC